MKKKLTKLQTAVAIAKDVLKQLKAGQYIAESCTYLAPEEGHDFLQNPKGELQKILKKEKPVCRVCAIGSALLSAVRLTNNFKLEDNVSVDSMEPRYNWIERSNMIDKLTEFFSEKECDDMEGVFESNGRVYLHPNLYDLDRIGDEKRLKWIMREIIRQKGHFDIKKAEKQAASEKQR